MGFRGLIPTICPKCGAKLDVRFLENKNSIACPYCDTPFVVDDASDSYHIHSSGDIFIDDATIVRGPSAENYVKRAKRFEQERDYDNALIYYNKALDIDADYEEAIEGADKYGRILFNYSESVRADEYVSSGNKYVWTGRRIAVDITLTRGEFRVTTDEKGKIFSLPPSYITKITVPKDGILRVFTSDVRKKYAGFEGEHVDIAVKTPNINLMELSNALTDTKEYNLLFGYSNGQVSVLLTKEVFEVRTATEGIIFAMSPSRITKIALQSGYLQVFTSTFEERTGLFGGKYFAGEHHDIYVKVKDIDIKQLEEALDAIR